MNRSEYRRKSVNKMYVAINKDGKDCGHTFAYNAAEAKDEFRRRKIKFKKIVKT